MILTRQIHLNHFFDSNAKLPKNSSSIPGISTLSDIKITEQKVKDQIGILKVDMKVRLFIITCLSVYLTRIKNKKNDPEPYSSYSRHLY